MGQVKVEVKRVGGMARFRLRKKGLKKSVEGRNIDGVANGTVLVVMIFLSPQKMKTILLTPFFPKRRSKA
jgi:hypothetical protein